MRNFQLNHHLFSYSFDLTEIFIGEWIDYICQSVSLQVYLFHRLIFRAKSKGENMFLSILCSPFCYFWSIQTSLMKDCRIIKEIRFACKLLKLICWLAGMLMWLPTYRWIFFVEWGWFSARHSQSLEWLFYLQVRNQDHSLLWLHLGSERLP